MVFFCPVGKQQDMIWLVDYKPIACKIRYNNKGENEKHEFL